MGVAFSESLNPEFAGVSFYSSWTLPTLAKAMRRARMVRDALAEGDDAALATDEPLTDLHVSRAQWHEVFTDFSHLLLPGQFLSIPSSFAGAFRSRRLPRLPEAASEAHRRRVRMRHLVPVVLPIAASVMLCDGPIPERITHVWQLFAAVDAALLPGRDSESSAEDAPSAAADTGGSTVAVAAGGAEALGLAEERTMSRVIRMLDGVADALSRAGMVAPAAAAGPVASGAAAAGGSDAAPQSLSAALKAAGRDERIRAAAHATGMMQGIMGTDDGGQHDAGGAASTSGAARAKGRGGKGAKQGRSSPRPGPAGASEPSGRKEAADGEEGGESDGEESDDATAAAELERRAARPWDAMAKATKGRPGAPGRRPKGVAPPARPPAAGPGSQIRSAVAVQGLVKRKKRQAQRDKALKRLNKVHDAAKAAAALRDGAAFGRAAGEAGARARPTPLGSFDVELNRAAVGTCEASAELAPLLRMLCRAKASADKYAAAPAPAGGAGTGASMGQPAAGAAGAGAGSSFPFPSAEWVSLRWFFDLYALASTLLAPQRTWRPVLNAARTRGWGASKRDAEVERRAVLALESSSRALLREWLAATLVLRLAEEQQHRTEAWRSKRVAQPDAVGSSPRAPELAPVLLVEAGAVSRARAALNAQAALLTRRVALRTVLDWSVTHPLPRVVLTRCGTVLGPAGSVSRRRSLIAHAGRDVRGSEVGSGATLALRDALRQGKRRPSHLKSALDEFKTQQRREERSRAAARERLARRLRRLVRLLSLRRGQLLEMQKAMAARAREGTLIDRWAFHGALAQAALAAGTLLYESTAEAVLREAGVATGAGEAGEQGSEARQAQAAAKRQKLEDSRIVARRLARVSMTGPAGGGGRGRRASPFAFVPPSASLSARMRDDDVARLLERQEEADSESRAAVAASAAASGTGSGASSSGRHASGPGVQALYERIVRQLKESYTAHLRDCVVALQDARAEEEAKQRAAMAPRALVPPPLALPGGRASPSSSSPPSPGRAGSSPVARASPRRPSIRAPRPKRASIVTRALASASRPAAGGAAGQGSALGSLLGKGEEEDETAARRQRRPSVSAERAAAALRSAARQREEEEEEEEAETAMEADVDPFTRRGVRAPPAPHALLDAAEAVFAAFDTGGEGVCDYMEVILGMGRFVEGSMSQRLTFLFDAYDEDGSGKLELLELVHVILNGRTASAARAATAGRGSFAGLQVGGLDQESGSDALAFAGELARLLDTDGDSVVTREEFISTLRREPVLLECLGDSLTENHYASGPRFDLRLLQAITMRYSHVPHTVMRRARRLRRGSVDLGSAVAMTGRQHREDPAAVEERAATLLDRSMSLSQFKRLMLEVFECPADALPLATRVFALFDEDASGSVDVRELYSGMLRAARGTLEQRAAFFFELFDDDGSGTLDMDEIKSLLVYAQSKKLDITQDDARQVARSLDADGSGSVDLEEWTQAIRQSPSILRHVSRVFGRTGLFRGQDAVTADAEAAKPPRPDSAASAGAAERRRKRAQRFRRASSVVAAAETMLTAAPPQKDRAGGEPPAPAGPRGRPRPPPIARPGSTGAESPVPDGAGSAGSAKAFRAFGSQVSPTPPPRPPAHGLVARRVARRAPAAGPGLTASPSRRSVSQGPPVVMDGTPLPGNAPGAAARQPPASPERSGAESADDDRGWAAWVASVSGAGSPAHPSVPRLALAPSPCVAAASAAAAGRGVLASPSRSPLLSPSGSDVSWSPRASPRLVPALALGRAASSVLASPLGTARGARPAIAAYRRAPNPGASRRLLEEAMRRPPPAEPAEPRGRTRRVRKGKGKQGGGRSRWPPQFGPHTAGAQARASDGRAASVVVAVPGSSESVGGVDGRHRREHLGNAPHTERLVTEEQMDLVREIGRWTAREVGTAKAELQEELRKLGPAFALAMTPVLPPGLEATLAPAFGDADVRTLRHRRTAARGLPPVALRAYNESVMAKLRTKALPAHASSTSSALLARASARVGRRGEEDVDAVMRRIRGIGTVVDSRSEAAALSRRDAAALHAQQRSHQDRMIREATAVELDDPVWAAGAAAPREEEKEEEEEEEEEEDGGGTGWAQRGRSPPRPRRSPRAGSPRSESPESPGLRPSPQHRLPRHASTQGSGALSGARRGPSAAALAAAAGGLPRQASAAHGSASRRMAEEALRDWPAELEGDDVLRSLVEVAGGRGRGGGGRGRQALLAVDAWRRDGEDGADGGGVAPAAASWGSGPPTKAARRSADRSRAGLLSRGSRNRVLSSLLGPSEARLDAIGSAAEATPGYRARAAARGVIMPNTARM